MTRILSFRRQSSKPSLGEAPLEPPHPAVTRYAVIRREIELLKAIQANTRELRRLRATLRQPGVA